MRADRLPPQPPLVPEDALEELAQLVIVGVGDQVRNLATKWPMNPFLPDGRFRAERTVSSNDSDDSFEPFVLTRGDHEAFEASCRRIRR
jgi:hypothetical protein